MSVKSSFADCFFQKWVPCYWIDNSCKSNTNDYLILNIGCECQTIVISLNNGALLHRSSEQGIYQRAGIVNGKTSWISSSGHALWYFPGSLDWMIATVDYLGTGTSGISSIGNQGISSCPYNVSNDDWAYWDGNVWIIPDANDINVECLAGNDRFVSLSFIWRSQYTPRHTT